MTEQPITYPRDAVLTHDEVASALRVSPRTLERMDLPTVYIGPRIRRYLWGEVLDALAKKGAQLPALSIPKRRRGAA